MLPYVRDKADSIRSRHVQTLSDRGVCEARGIRQGENGREFADSK